MTVTWPDAAWTSASGTMLKRACRTSTWHSRGDSAVRKRTFGGSVRSATQRGAATIVSGSDVSLAASTSVL